MIKEENNARHLLKRQIDIIFFFKSHRWPSSWHDETEMMRKSGEKNCSVVSRFDFVPVLKFWRFRD